MGRHNYWLTGVSDGDKRVRFVSIHDSTDISPAIFFGYRLVGCGGNMWNNILSNCILVSPAQLPENNWYLPPFTTCSGTTEIFVSGAIKLYHKSRAVPLKFSEQSGMVDATGLA